jgi:hypothetical protein
MSAKEFLIRTMVALGAVLSLAGHEWEAHEALRWPAPAHGHCLCPRPLPRPSAGLLSPWLAALFHHISSVMVVLNSARLVHNERASF